MSMMPSDSESAKTPRKAISKRLRYEVLRRDDHACRYCGVRAPDVVLTVDHIIPVALGGTDDPSNLGAACRDCNSGKSASSPDAPLVAEVNADAVRWLRALEKAQEIAEQRYADDDVLCDSFEAHWNSYTYGNWKNERSTYALPPDWRLKVADLLRTPGITARDVEDSVAIALSAKYVEDEFRYFIGVLNNKMAQRQAIARQLMNNGLA